MRKRLIKATEDHPLATGSATLAVIILLTALSGVSLNGIPGVPKYELKAVMDPRSFEVKTGDEVRIGGVRTGTVTEVKPAGQNRIVSFWMEPEHGPVGGDARATLRQKGPAGRIYLEIDRGDWRRDPQPEDWTIPRSQTFVYRDLIAVLEDFDAQSRRAAAQTMARHGGAIMGHGDDLNQLLADLPAITRDVPPIIRSTRPRVLPDMLGSTERVLRSLGEPGRGDLEQLMPATRLTLEALANRRDELGETLDRLRPFEDEARPTLALARPVLEDATLLTGELRPGVRALTAAAPDLVRLLGSGRTLREEVRRLTPAINPVLRAGIPLLRELRPAAIALAPLVPPVAELAAHVAPYEEEIEAFQTVQDDLTGGVWSHPRPEGTSPGANSVRVFYVLTCAPGHRAHRPPDVPLGTDRTEECTPGVTRPAPAAERSASGGRP